MLHKYPGLRAYRAVRHGSKALLAGTAAATPEVRDSRVHIQGVTEETSFTDIQTAPRCVAPSDSVDASPSSPPAPAPAPAPDQAPAPAPAPAPVPAVVNDVNAENAQLRAQVARLEAELARRSATEIVVV